MKKKTFIIMCIEILLLIFLLSCAMEKSGWAGTIEEENGVTPEILLLMNPNEQEKWIDRSFKYWRKRGFPYYKLSDSEIKREYILKVLF